MKRIFYLAVIALMGLFQPACAQAGPSPAEQQIFDELNQIREKAGLQKLQWDNHVAEAARKHSEIMAENERLDHQFPGEDTVSDRIGVTGARFSRSAENVARTEYLEDVNLALMNSPGHRANMMNPQYNAVGIGVVVRKKMLFVTQDFVLLIPAYSEAQFSDALVEAVNHETKSRGIRFIQTETQTTLHNAACSTDGESRRVAGNIAGASAVVVFTSSEPAKLPQQFMNRVINPGFHRMALGVCFRPDRQYGYANFWVVAAFYS